MGTEKIWKDSLRAVYQSDFALKLLTEGAGSMTPEQALVKRQKLAEAQDFKNCIDSKKSLN